MNTEREKESLKNGNTPSENLKTDISKLSVVANLLCKLGLPHS